MVNFDATESSQHLCVRACVSMTVCLLLTNSCVFYFKEQQQQNLVIKHIDVVFKADHLAKLIVFVHINVHLRLSVHL